MRISDWSSDVCSSDLLPRAKPPHTGPRMRARLSTAWLKPMIAPCTLAGAAFDSSDCRQERHMAMPAPSSMSARSEEHTSELQSLMRISYAVFCLKKKKRRIYDIAHDDRPIDTVNTAIK